MSSDAPSTTAWKRYLRRTPGGDLAVKAVVFSVGLLFILLGFLLVALPGPLTIPPILVGLYVWSTEFAWAERLLERAKRSAREAWRQAQARPVVTALVTVSGLAALVAGVYLVGRYDLLERIQDAVGL